MLQSVDTLLSRSGVLLFVTFNAHISTVANHYCGQSINDDGVCSRQPLGSTGKTGSEGGKLVPRHHRMSRRYSRLRGKGAFLLIFCRPDLSKVVVRVAVLLKSR